MQNANEKEGGGAMTAMELYREDRQQRRTPQRRPRQEYFATLRDTLHDELMREGRSEFLDEMLAECSGGKALPMLEFAALRECYEMIVENQPMQDATVYVPHIYRTETERFAWRELEQGAAYRVDNPEFPELLTRLRSVSRQLVMVRDQTIVPEVHQAAQREIDGLMLLNRTLESENQQLRQEREELRARIAALESGYISEQLRQRLEVRRRQAESQLEEEMQERRVEQEAALRRALRDAAERQHRKLQAAQGDGAETAQQRADAYAEIRDALQRQTAALQAQLDGQMAALKARLYAEDHRFLARSAVEMMAAAEHGLAQALASAQHLNADAALVQELADAQSGIGVHLAQLEKAMQQLGMQVFRPEPGEAFDPDRHSPVSASGEAADGLRIAAIETPGVLLRMEGEEKPGVLVRAVVHTVRGT